MNLENLRSKYHYPWLLIRQLVKSDFKLRYQGSVLGYLWSLLRPMAIFITLYIVFVKFLRIGGDVPHFSMYLLLGIILWNFFLEATNGSIVSIVNKGDVIRKIWFPKYIIVVAVSAQALINLLINFGIVAFFIWFLKIDLRFDLVFLPLVVAQLYIFSLAVSFLLASVYVRFRDIGHIWEVVSQAAFYGTPILYPLTLVPEQAAKLLILNPLAQIIQDARFVLITDQSITINQLYGGHKARLITYGLTLLILFVAAWYFRRSSRSFAEMV